METEYKLYITNPKYFNSNQSDFEKNLSGKVVVKETLLSTGFTEKSTVGYVFGIPTPFINPQTNANVPDNNGSMILHGEASLFSPAKVLLNEMIAIITDTFFIKYGVNIDFSLDSPEEIKNTEDKNEEEKNAIIEKSADTSTISGATDTSIAGTNNTVTNDVSGFKFNFDKDLGKKVLIGAGVLAGAGALALGIKVLAGMSMSRNKDKPSIAPIEDNKIKGIKILVPSQYIDVYEISKYGGAPALVTTKESKQMVWIDKDYDRPEFMPSNLTSPLKLNDDLTGDFKINIHLGYPGGKKVGNWSEDGSQVFSTPDDLNDFFKLCEAHKEKYGNKLTYTLSTKKDWDEAQKNVQTNQAAPPTPPAVVEPIVGSPSTPPEKIDEILLGIKDLIFDTNKSDIKQENFEGLDKLSELLKKETSWKLTIEGYTDSIGSSTSNLELSKKRAASAKKYLLDKGVAAGMITSDGYGETKPIGDNTTKEGQQKNRRVVFTITKPDKTTISSANLK